MDVRILLIVEMAVTIEVTPVVTVPVYEYVVMALVVVSVRVPVKLVTVVNIIEELCLGPTVAATELLKQEAKATTAIAPKTMLEMARDAFNQAFS